MLFLLPALLRAQVVTLSPVFPTQNDVVTVTFDATGGNAALAGQSVVYAHTGVITSLSSSATAWRYVQGNWGTDDARVKMTSIGNNKFQLTYHIASFYGVPSAEKVLKLAFVFRNQDGSKVGRNADASDIFAEISDGSFQLLLDIQPSGSPPVLTLNDTLKITGQGSARSNLWLMIRDSVYAASNDTTMLWLQVPAASLGYGKHRIYLKSELNGTGHTDSSYVIIRPATASNVGNPPAGVRDGINYIDDNTVVLQLLAPFKNYVYAIGDFSNWELDPACELTRTPDGNRFWVRIDSLVAGREYRFQYSINKELLRVADPFADKLLDQHNDRYIPAETYPDLIPYPGGITTEYVSVFQTGQATYEWKHSTGFTKPAPDNLVIYELLIRDFIGRHDYRTLTDTLDYLQRLGVNAIELMPFNEFEGNESWGYNTVFYFAPDKYYGTKNDLKAFIDECHRRGIAVIMDMVLNHSFGQSSMVRMYFDNATGKPLNNPWFNADATHPYNVGYDFNHESSFTQAFVDTVLRYWVNEYHIDGYRFDLSKGFTQRNNPGNVAAWSAYDQSRINILKRMYDRMRQVSSDCYMILEHFADNNEEKELSSHGFMLWGNINHDFSEATMGYPADLSWASYAQRGWQSPNVVAYAESHDEERLMFKNLMYGAASGTYQVKDTATALARCEAAAVLLATLPGPHMIWQFGELGYGYSINHCPNGTIDESCRVANKPIRWDYTGQPARRRLYDVHAAINHLKTSRQVFRTRDFSYSLDQPVKTITLRDSSMNVVFVANFGTTDLRKVLFLPHAGMWYNYFSGDSVLFGDHDTLQIDAGNYALFTDVPLARPEVTPVTGLTETGMDGKLSLYPNPATGMVYITCGQGPDSYTICSVSGAIVASGELERGNPVISTSGLPSGMYFLTIRAGQMQATRKLLINH